MLARSCLSRGIILLCSPGFSANTLLSTSSSNASSPSLFCFENALFGNRAQFSVRYASLVLKEVEQWFGPEVKSYLLTQSNTG